MLLLYLYLTDILPLIEFQLEDNISDTEALKLIQCSNNISKSNESQNIPQNFNTLIIEEENQIDPFTHKLMNFEVNSF